MKLLTTALLALVLAVPAAADDSDNLLQNADFSSGLDHWYGGGRSPADFANDNPLQASDPLTSKGLIMPLHSESWTKVAQDFKGKSSTGVLTITFKVSPDFAFSTKPEDYVNMPDKIGYDGWRAFDTKIGAWVVFVSDFGSAKGTYCMIMPKTGSSDLQTYRTVISGLTPLEDKTITLAFPPGTGMLVVESVSMTGQ
jgi:hypothetical protein